MERFNVKNEKIYKHIMAFIVFLICIFRYNVMQNPYFTPDEVGYWAAGAWIQGIDWSPIFSHIAYYGWGYGLILAPLFFIHNTAIKFHCAIIINTILLTAIYYLLVYIFKQIFSNYEYKKILLIAFATTLYSYHIAYAHLTMCEVYLTLVFILSICVLINISKQATYLNVSVYALVVGIQISIHLRMIILLFVSILVLGYMFMIKKINIRHVLVFWGIILIEILFIYKIKDLYIDSQYTMKIVENFTEDINRQGVNDSITMRLSVLKNISSIDFWEKLFFSLIGKLFYLCCASFFTILFGFQYIVSNILKSLKELKEKKTQSDKFIGVWIYVAFSFLGALALNAISLMYANRFEHLFYGRYTENVVAFIIFLGIKQIVDNKVKINKVILCLLFNLGMSILLYLWIKQNNYVGVLPLQCSVFAGLFARQNVDYASQFTIYIILLVIIIFLVFYILSKNKVQYGTIVLGIVWSIIAYRGLDMFIYPEITRMNAIVDIAEDIDSRTEKVWTLIPDDTNVHIAAFVDAIWLQFQLDDRTVNVVDENRIDMLTQDDILIISKYYPNSYEISQKYNVLSENSEMYILRTN